MIARVTSQLKLRSAHKLEESHYKGVRSLSYSTTRSWIEYQSYVLAERNPIFRDETLLVYFGKELIGIIPLSVHGDEELRVLSAFGKPIEVFLKESAIAGELPIYGSIVPALQELVDFYDTSKPFLLMTLEAADKAAIEDRWLKSSVQWNRLICNLNIPEDVLFLTLRNSYRALIRKFSKIVEIEISNSSTAAMQMEILRRLHFEAAGRATRSDKSWKYQLESILNNEGFVILGKLEGTYIGGSFINISNKDAYYSVGAYSREMQQKKFPVAHVLIWEAIKVSKSAGLQKFCMGEFAGSGLTSKEKSIILFKKGFATEEQNLEMIEVGK